MTEQMGDMSNRRILDVECIRKALAGDQAAFTDLIQSYWKQFYFQALNYVHNHTEAEEIVQQGIIKIHQNLSTLREPEKFGYWGNAIIKYLCLDYLRAKKRELQVMAEYSENMQVLHSGNSSQESSRTIIEDHSRHQLILHAIAKLHEKYRIIAILYFSKELTCREIADQLQIPIGTVEVRLHRAKKMLQKLLRGRL
jgi:RNA polymerase sigma-70 factor (ECF subfamily)